MTHSHHHDRPDGAPVLKVTGLKKAYGAIQAVGGVSFQVQPGEIFGVIGPNGSGKTTLFNSMLGQITPDEGKIELNGEDVTQLGPLELNRRGVGRTFQTLQVFGKMTVRDNLIVAPQEHSGTMFSRMFAPTDSGLGAKADALIDQFRIRHVADKKAGAGVNPSLVGGISTLLKELNRNPAIGKHSSFVVIEHNMDFVMDLCHRIMVMVEGKVMAIGTPDEIRGNKQVLDAYLGS
jgi:branched-chain amino acid transport system ATP-binding protein